MIDYLTSQAAQDQPFFLVVSIVNPHDVLMYPSKYIDAGFRIISAPHVTGSSS